MSLDITSLPMENVAATELVKGDIIFDRAGNPVHIMRILRQKRPRNQSTVLKSLPPANGGPVEPDRLIFLVRPMNKQRYLGFNAMHPADLDAVFTRVVLS